MANKQFQDRINLNLKKNAISLNIALISFKEEELFVLYSPTLDLYGYGDDEGEALNSFNDTIFLYLEYCMGENTIAQDLDRLGWTRHQKFKKRFNTDKYSPKDIMLKKGVKDYGIYDVNKQLQLQEA